MINEQHEYDNICKSVTCNCNQLCCSATKIPHKSRENYAGFGRQ